MVIGRWVGMAVLGAVVVFGSTSNLIQAEPSAAPPGDIRLLENGTTAHVIVKPDNPSPVDEYAIRVLADFLKRKTAVDFPVVPSRDLKGRKGIFVGLGAAALENLGGDPAGPLQDREFVARSVGDNIYLYGKGLHGNLYAVVDFLDASLGRRWCVDTDKPVPARVDSLSVGPFSRRKKFSFAYRMLGFPSEFNYQQGYNLCLTKTVCRDFGLPEGTLPVVDNPVWVHTSFLYIPPEPGGGFEWLKDKGYFRTNPEFFGMDEGGQRVPQQLCYGGPGLRAELTKNIFDHIRRVRKESRGLPLLIALDQEDPGTGKLCSCPACLALEKKYANPAGAFHDYVLELGAKLEAEQPGVLLKIIAYRRSQTQIPPTMPEGVAYPRNVVVVFCNVEDVLNKTWNDPENSPTYRDLLGWMKLTPRVWVWYYYLYGAALLMPFNFMDRLAGEMRMAKRAGAEGMIFELYPEGGFTDVLQYLYLKLAQDVDSDARAHLRDFCEAQYGPAAPPARKYIEEVEAASKTGKKDMGIIHANIDFKASFSYLTDENIRRWQGMFEEMDRLAGEETRLKDNLRRLRRSLDLATMGKWNSLSKAYPDYFADYRVPRKRIGEVGLVRASTLEDWELKIKAGDVHRPLPPVLNGIPRESISEFVPLNTAGKDKIKNVLDAEAAFGYATTVSDPDMPFNFGFYQNDTKKGGPDLKIDRKDITPGAWKTYRLGEIRLTPNCLIWFSSKSWMTNLELGTVFKPDSENLYDAYASLKFTGAAYGGEGENRVLCDRIVLVDKGRRK